MDSTDCGSAKNIVEYILSLCAGEATFDDLMPTENLVVTRDIKEIFVLSN